MDKELIKSGKITAGEKNSIRENTKALNSGTYHINMHYECSRKSCILSGSSQLIIVCLLLLSLYTDQNEFVQTCSVKPLRLGIDRFLQALRNYIKGLNPSRLQDDSARFLYYSARAAAGIRTARKASSTAFISGVIRASPSFARSSGIP